MDFLQPRQGKKNTSWGTDGYFFSVKGFPTATPKEKKHVRGPGGVFFLRRGCKGFG